MEEKILPKLLRGRKEAEKKIQEQIDRGQQLRDRRIDSETELDKVKAEVKKWSNYNETLLRTLFDNSSIASKYVVSSRRHAFLTGQSLSAKIEEYRGDVSKAVNHLEGICEQLGLYGESSDTRSSNFGTEVFIVHGRDDGTKETCRKICRETKLKSNYPSRATQCGTNDH